MTRILFSLLLMFSFAGKLFAQDVLELMITFDKRLPPINAVQIKLSGSEKGAEEILFEKMRKGSAMKPKKEGDVMMLRGAIIPEISQTKMDYSYRVEKATTGSTITFYTSLGNNNYIRSDKYPTEIENVKKFLSSIEKELKVFDQEALIKEQQEVVKKEEGKVKDAEKNAADADKKVKEAQSQLEKAQKAVQDAKGSLDSEKTKLQGYEATLKGLKG